MATRHGARGSVRVGCSGWQYRDWRNRVYPAGLPTKMWFSYYAGQFDTVELNATFYRLPAAETFDHWARAAPPGFLYALKLGSFGTHRMKLRDAASWLPNHVERARRLGAALGPTLVQLPPRWKRNAARLDEFFAAAPADMRWAVEVRDPSWLHDEVYEVLRQHDAALCIHDLLADHPWTRTAGWTYLRFHGPEATSEKYQGRYGAARLGRIAGRLDAWIDEGTDVYAYFNNDAEGHSFVDARRLRERLQPAPTQAV